MNARFWHNDVKLTLRPGDVIRLYRFCYTDEGHDFSEVIFEHDGDSIIRTTASGGCDCDGPIEHHTVSEVPLWKMCPNPEWKRISSYQRDHYAEAAGY